MEDKLLTKYEVMDYLNISRRHFEKLVTEENLPIIKITQNKRYMRLSDLHRYLNTKMVNKPQEVYSGSHNLISNGTTYGVSDDVEDKIICKS